MKKLLIFAKNPARSTNLSRNVVNLFREGTIPENLLLEQGAGYSLSSLHFT